MVKIRNNIFCTGYFIRIKTISSDSVLDRELLHCSPISILDILSAFYSVGQKNKNGHRTLFLID